MTAVLNAGDWADEIAKGLEKRLGIRGQGLEAKLARAGRSLPRWVRRDGAVLAEAARLSASPKLAKRVDPARVAKAHASVSRYLADQDPRERRKDKVLALLAVNVFNLTLFATLLGVFLTRYAQL
jgi:hypothetical protein